MTGYTHRINYYRNVDGLGWVFESFKTTPDALPKHLHNLYQSQQKGVVRSLETIKLK